MSLYVHGLGHFHPENQITNRFLVDLDIGTTEEWILERVGIRSRRTVLPLDYIATTRNRDVRGAVEASIYTNADMGARAAEMAIARAGIRAADVGMVLAGGSTPDTVCPAEACNVACRLGLEVPAFDVNSACTSFFALFHVLSIADPAKLPEFVLLVCPEGFTRTVSYDDRSSAVLWGDAAAAAVVSTRVPGPIEVLGSTLASSPAGNAKVVVPRVGHFRQDGRTVQMFAIRRSIEGLERLRSSYGQEGRRFHFVGHQANLRMLEAVCRHCRIPPALHHSNVEDYGNTGAASGCSVVSMRWDEFGALDDVAMVGVGSGLTWGGELLRFGSRA
jgi:3-oxoacyl-[acyl-carrier-protein] synthase III